MSDVENDIDTEIEQKVIEKLKKVIKPKSEKQLAHIEKLAAKRRGSKYVKVEPEEPKIEKEPEVVKQTRKAKAVQEPVVEKLKPKERKPKKRVVYISESESSATSEEEVVVVKKKPKPKPKRKVQDLDLDLVEVEDLPTYQRHSYFNTDIC